ncbi:cation:proton antiporter [Geomonas anaerohicana]|uniref:Monovalent cation/H(+) antiporter subunit G n=1 Tax=Geomonas anaerohicana TaxID=2798583 RepID=A0ABS0YBR9_9BACT|nr:monovalent cation/H(+) antiporter subunit G [Geomonas anaerohicana]MBJ6749748.1 monovalent cation/H(+) antiporter subunit G [Geomonas anaerohicana]
MSPDLPAGIGVTLLTCFALAVCAFSCLGLLVMRGLYRKLHYLAPPAVLGCAAVTAAIAVQEGMGAATIKAGLVLLVLVIGNPVITFAAARAHYLREEHAKHQKEGGR